MTSKISRDNTVFSLTLLSTKFQSNVFILYLFKQFMVTLM